MNSQDLIRQVQESCGEWLEMTESPDALVSGILANKVIALQDHIEYLERRLEYARVK
jgi:hypothetical protein